MRDKISFDYAEAQANITCAVCSYTFMAFPDSEQSVITCPKCDRHYKFIYQIEALNRQEVLKQKMKNNLLLPNEDDI